jgi:hypothetical protein
MNKDKHAKQRFKERHNIKFSAKLKRYIIKQIQNNKAEFLKRTSLSRTLWMVTGFDGNKYRVVYSKTTKSIITVLSNRREYNEN